MKFTSPRFMAKPASRKVRRRIHTAFDACIVAAVLAVQWDPLEPEETAP